MDCLPKKYACTSILQWLSTYIYICTVNYLLSPLSLSLPLSPSLSPFCINGTVAHRLNLKLITSPLSVHPPPLPQGDKDLGAGGWLLHMSRQLLD